MTLSQFYFPDFYFAGIQKKILKVKHTVDHLNGGSLIVAKMIRFESFAMAPVVTRICISFSIGVGAKFRVFHLTQYT